MSAEWHRVTVVSAKDRRGVCSVCGPIWLKRRERRGGVEWSCGRRHAEYGRGASPRRHRRQVEVQPWCERCSFFPEHPAQLDVHHRDGDHSNNALENLQVLCANCHRLEHIDPHEIREVGGFTAREIRLSMLLADRRSPSEEERA